MNRSDTSMTVFAVYLGILSLVLVFHPAPFLLLGFEDVSSPFVPVLGYVVGALAFYYLMAVRQRMTAFYRWSVLARLPLLPFFVALALFERVPPIMILIGLWDSGCALWTAYALHREQSTGGR